MSDTSLTQQEWERAKELSSIARKAIGGCAECVRKSRRLHACDSCFAVYIATAMLECRIGRERVVELRKEDKFKPFEGVKL